MRRLGRLPHNASAVAAAPVLRYAAEVPPPTTLDRSSVKYQPQMFDNDTLPDCPVAGLLNAALAVNALAGAGGLSIAADCWLPFYAAVAGCAPTREAIAATDGLNLLDTLRRQGTQGFGIGAVAPLTGDFGTVPLNRAALASCCARLGFVYLGVELAQSDVDEAADAVWGPTATDPSLGHCLLLWDYTGLGDDDQVGLVTWGGFQECTWLGLEARVREAYAILFPDVEAVGVDVAGLKAANAQWLST